MRNSKRNAKIFPASDSYNLAASGVRIVVTFSSSLKLFSLSSPVLSLENFSFETLQIIDNFGLLESSN